MFQSEVLKNDESGGDSWNPDLNTPEAGSAKDSPRADLILYRFSDLHHYLPARYLDPPGFHLLQPSDYRTAASMANTSARLDFLRRRICLYSGLESWFAESQLPPLTAEDRLALGCLGKPRLERPDGDFGLFNLSARENGVVLGISTGRDVGVDLEDADRTLTDRGMESVMKYYYSAAERSAVRDATDPRFEFLRIWTVKEAAVKALGLSIGSHGQLVDSSSRVWLNVDGRRVTGQSGNFSSGDRYLWSAALVLEKGESLPEVPGEGSWSMEIRDGTGLLPVPDPE